MYIKGNAEANNKVNPTWRRTYELWLRMYMHEIILVQLGLLNHFFCKCCLLESFIHYQYFYVLTRWFEGSSSNIMCGFLKVIFANATRLFWPPGLKKRKRKVIRTKCRLQVHGSDTLLFKNGDYFFDQILED